MAGPAYYAAVVNIAQNEDWIVPFTYGSQVDAETFTPIDITGSVFTMEIRKHEHDHEAIVSVNSPDNGITIDNAVGGQFTITIDRDKLVRLFPGSYVTDLVREMPNGYVERIFEGTVTSVEGSSR